MNEDSNKNDATVPLTQVPESLATIRASLTVHEGPLPSPETVERYERVLPGAFDRILTMAEKEQQNTFEQRSIELTLYGRNASSKILFAHCGQIFGFASVVFYFSILALTVWFGNTTMFTALFCAGAFAGLARLVRSFQNKNGKTL